MGFDPGSWVKDKFKEVEKGVQNIGKEIEKGVSGLGKNIEGNVQQTLGAVGGMFNGDLNNIGRTLLDAALLTSAGGLINNDDISRLTGTETNVNRRVREGEEAIKNQAAADLAAQAAERQRQAASTISGIVSGYNRTPGRSASLLGSASANNTLLTLVR